MEHDSQHRKKDQFWLSVPGWERFPNLICGFSGRVDDRAAALADLYTTQLPLYTVKQVHGNQICTITQDSQLDAERPQADGMITPEAGHLLGIATADCVPVLMVAPDQGIVAALHAGWRGTAKAICIRAIEQLKTDWNVSPEQLWVAFGPAIGGCCYEVSRDIGEELCSQSSWSERGALGWQPRGEKGLLDLRLVNRLQCEHLGIPAQHIQNVGPCTLCAGGDFASYRREGSGAGRQLSVIGWQNEPSKKIS